MDKGPWRVHDSFERGIAGGLRRTISVLSDDFDHDVSIEFRGDFANNDDRRKYADWLCAALNRASLGEGDSR